MLIPHISCLDLVAHNPAHNEVKSALTLQRASGAGTVRIWIQLLNREITTMSVLSNWKGHEQLAASGPLFDNT